MWKSLRPLWPLLVIVAVVSLAMRAWQAHHDSRWGQAARSAAEGALASAAGRAAQPSDAQELDDPRLWMLSSRSCAICPSARHWLNTHAVPYRECFIEEDAACQARFEAVRAVGTPTFVMGERTMSGFRPEPFSAWLSLAAASPAPRPNRAPP